MGKYQVSVVIDRPVEEAFGFVAEVENVSRWTGFGEVYVTSDGPMRVGTTTKQVTIFLGRRFEVEADTIQSDDQYTMVIRHSAITPPCNGALLQARI